MTYTIIIDKTKAEPTPEEPTLDGSTIVYFEAKNPACDNADVSQLIKVTSANYSTSKGTKTYKGANYGECMKMESSTVFTLTATDPCTITLVADVASKNIKVDDVAYKTDSNGCYTFTAVAGKTYTIKKGDSMNLFAIDFEPTATAVQNISAATSANASAVAKKIADGRLIIEANGKQFNAAGAQIK
jgi:hypothetical protein